MKSLTPWLMKSGHSTALDMHLLLGEDLEGLRLGIMGHGSHSWKGFPSHIKVHSLNEYRPALGGCHIGVSIHHHDKS